MASIPQPQLYTSLGQLFSVLLLVSSFSSCFASKDSCHHIRTSVGKISGLNSFSQLIPVRPTSSDTLSVCLPRNGGKTCCTAALEAEFLNSSKKDLAGALRSSNDQLLGFVKESAREIRATLEESLVLTEEMLKKQFRMAFALMVEKNETKRAMEHLFSTLRRLSGLSQGSSDALMSFDPQALQAEVEAAVGEFFAEMFAPAFHCIALVNHCKPGKSLGISPAREQCFKRHFAMIRPFKNEPEYLGRKMGIGILRLRSVAEIWTWMERDLESRMENLENNFSAECVEEFTRMNYCSLCSDETFESDEKKLCVGYCSGVIGGCLESAQLGLHFVRSWEDRIKALRAVSGADFSHRSDTTMYGLPILTRQTSFAIDGEEDGGNTTTTTTEAPSLRVGPVLKRLRQRVVEMATEYGHWFTGVESRLCNSVHKGNSNCWNGRAIGQYTDTLTLGETGGKGVETPTAHGKGEATHGPHGDIDLDQKMKNLQKVLSLVNRKDKKNDRLESASTNPRRSSSMLVRSTDGRRQPDLQNPHGRDQHFPEGHKSSDLVREGSGDGGDSETGDVIHWYENSDDEDSGGSGSGDWEDQEVTTGIHRYGGDRKGAAPDSGVVPIFPDDRKPPDHKISESHPGDKKKGEKPVGGGVSGAPGSLKVSHCLLSWTLSASLAASSLLLCRRIA